MIKEESINKTYIEEVREKFNLYGVEEASIGDLLALIIGQNKPEIITKLSCLDARKLVNMSIYDFLTFDNEIKPKMAEGLAATMALCIKLSRTTLPARHVIRSPEDAARYMMSEMRHLNQEHFIALYLNSKNQVIHKKAIFIGSLNASTVHPREIYGEAFRQSAASVICLHNHPSGLPDPSPENIELTKRLNEVGNITRIALLDHIIIGDKRYCSLKEKGYL